MDDRTQAMAEELLEHRFRDPAILREALTHASMADTRLTNNERMEFLGDAILGVIVCHYLFSQYPHLMEGDLTKIKSAAVSRRSCAKIAKAAGLEGLLQLGKGMSNRVELPSSLAAAVFESLIAAVYLDGGFDEAAKFVLRHLAPMISRLAQGGHQHNFKSILQQYAQETFGQSTTYVLLDENGPDHAKCFETCVEIGARRFAACWGPSKKQAEQRAALTALVELGLAKLEEDGDEVILLEGVGADLSVVEGEEAVETEREAEADGVAGLADGGGDDED